MSELIESSKLAVKHSQAKYSNFRVGAALLTEDQQIFTGCNIESSSYSLTICAERVALVKALSDGKTKFSSIAIFAEKAEFCSPCGACRQLLYDYAEDLDVILTDGKKYKTYKIKDLLPVAFEESQLNRK
ncbi:MAG: cytidine deaminase [Calditrichaeota bacterium]|nr:MAG: cytidine deaminase [Calditrichota bacterium]MBL1205854.1 cytidine deaminase [Calditrichota bacterium]NOG45681.1 cytidine deaminase [Calditrichota bacterium]